MMPICGRRLMRSALALHFVQHRRPENGTARKADAFSPDDERHVAQAVVQAVE
jgi:hypothetical protein